MLAHVTQIYFVSSGNYDDPRPPEVENDTLDTSILDADPDTAQLLLEMFISELQEPKSWSKEEESGVREDTPLDGDAETSLPSSAIASGVPSPLSMTEVSPSASLECMNSTNYTDPLDNPFLMEFTDLSELLNTTTTDTTTAVLDPTLASGTTSPVSSPMFQDATNVAPSNNSPHDLCTFDLSDCTHLFSHTTTVSEIASASSTPVASSHEDFTLDLSCVSDDDLNTLLNSPEDISVDQLSLLLSQTQDQHDLSSVATSESPACVPDVTDSQAEPESQTTKKARKRKASEIESICDVGNTQEPQPKKSKENKYLIRRQKNNEASRISRAKRREKHSTVFTRETDLEEENARLRTEIEKMEAETAKLKKLLIERLSQ